MSDSEPKTEPASAKKIRDALKKGDRPKSILVSNAISFVVWMLVGYLGWTSLVAVIWPIAESSMRWNPRSPFGEFHEATMSLVIISVSLVSICALIVAVLTNLISLGVTHGQLSPAPEALKPKFEKFNPAANAKNLFSLKQLYQLVRNILFVLVLMWVAYLAGKHYLGTALSIYRGGDNAIKVAALNALAIAFSVGLAVTALFALADRSLEKLLWLKNLKMTKSEVKREHHEQEGNPHIKGQRNAIARQAARAARSDAEKYGNLVVHSTSAQKIVVMHTSATLKHPLVLWKENGGEAEMLVRKLSQYKIEILIDDHVVDFLYPKALVGDLLNKSLSEQFNQNRRH
jgi:flagellar biosynthesis protein FlhB